MKGNGTAGHLASLLTIIIWGTTFISTKILLVNFQPAEILFFRFVIGSAALLLAYPRRLKGTSTRQELTFAAAGLCGICLYYLLENIALPTLFLFDFKLKLARLAGLFLSESKLFLRKGEKQNGLAK